MGLRNHSEIGWVQREYNALKEQAQRLNIKSPEDLYDEGKIKGKAGRGKGIGGQKNGEKNCIAEASDHESRICPVDIAEESLSTYTPRLSGLPELIRQADAVEMPGLLKGFRPVQRK